jgi:hypothetical protein
MILRLPGHDLKAAARDDRAPGRCHHCGRPQPRHLLGKGEILSGSTSHYFAATENRDRKAAH